MGVIMQTVADARAGQPSASDDSPRPRRSVKPTGPFSMNFRTNLYTDNLDAATIHQGITLLLAVAALVNARGGA